jgi:hypothetical protein
MPNSRNIKMDKVKRLEFRNGNQVYFLYSERRSDDTQPIGFFGRVLDLVDNPLNQTFNVKGYELLMPAYKVCFDREDLISNPQNMPSLVIPRNDIRKMARVHRGDTEVVVELANSLDGLFNLMTQRRFIPSSRLYEQMQKAVKKIRA